MLDLITKAWKKVSFIGLREYTEKEAILDFREVVLINRFIFILIVTMILYMPLEFAFNGTNLLYPIIVQISVILATLYWNHKKWFLFSKFYFFSICVLVIVPMLYVIPEGAKSEFLLFPVSLIPAMLFSKKWISHLMFFIVLGIFFITYHTRAMVEPIVIVHDDTLYLFSHFFLTMAFGLVYFIAYYFKSINLEYQDIIDHKNQELNEFNEEVLAQRDQINEQKQVIEHKHNEIKASINYAKRIQEAILPPMDVVNSKLPNCFIYYKPKDIVAGDFYWFESNNNVLFFAVADCTGHGVPGAMVSVVCNNALNRSVREFKLQEPAKILDKTRELVIETFLKTDGSVKDGMDISLIKIDQASNTVEWAGANNPIILIRNGIVEVIKGDREPIGYTFNATPFTNHPLDMNQVSALYLLTDGYQDQFGGPNGKKYMIKRLKEKLLAIQSNDIHDQSKILDEEIEQWMAQDDSTQIDDICIAGIQMN